MANDGNPGVGVCPETVAGAADLGVPGLELGESDAVLLGDGRADLVLGNKVEGVTVVYHVWLRGRRRRDAVWRLSAGGLGPGMMVVAATDNEGYGQETRWRQSTIWTSSGPWHQGQIWW